jgi:hypothetical protein
MHADADDLVRSGSVETQVFRNRPTMLAAMAQLLEDHSDVVRWHALIACGVFRNETQGLGARQGMLLRLLEESDSDDDVGGAALALRMMTDEHFGFGDADVDVQSRSVDDAAVAAFKSDREGRRLAVEKWRAKLGGAAAWTAEDRRRTLESMLTHADPENVARAKAELAKLPK